LPPTVVVPVSPPRCAPPPVRSLAELSAFGARSGSRPHISHDAEDTHSPVLPSTVVASEVFPLPSSDSVCGLDLFLFFNFPRPLFYRRRINVS